MRPPKQVRALAVAALLTVGVAGTVVGCAHACPTALAEGVLVAEQGDLLLQGRGGEAQRIVWPSGLGVREQDGRLVLADWLGNVKAREGDWVDVGGGFGTDNVFHGCGDVTVISPPPP